MEEAKVWHGWESCLPAGENNELQHKATQRIEYVKIYERLLIDMAV